MSADPFFSSDDRHKSNYRNENKGIEKQTMTRVFESFDKAFDRKVKVW